MSALAGDFTIKSSAFDNNQRIPIEFTCNGSDVSPPLSWENPPAKTGAFALVFSTTDWSFPINLWIIYNIPANLTKLDKGANDHLPEGTLVGSNFYYDDKYDGPCPPDNKLHHYIFTLYALDSMLDDQGGDVDSDDLLTLIKQHTLQQTQLFGVYSH